jgi:hypothetical protein
LAGVCSRSGRVVGAPESLRAGPGSPEDEAILADTYTGLNPAAVQRQIQALTTELRTITTSKAGPKTKATAVTRASSDQATNQTSRAS